MKILKLISVILIVALGCRPSYSQNMDVNTLMRIQDTRTPFMNSTMNGVSFSAYVMAPAVPLAMLGVGLVTSNSNFTMASLQIGAGILLTTATTMAMKSLFHRPRPYDNYPGELHPLQYEKSYSFPSGHTSVAFATATSLSLQMRKWYVAVPAFLWAVTVGYSRMYLGVHYPSDVLVGALVGVASAYITYKIQEIVKPDVQVPLLKFSF